MNQAQKLAAKIEGRTARIGVIGLGYVGLPLVLRFTEERFRVLGFDIDPVKVEKLNRGESYIKHIPGDKIRRLRDSGLFEATADYSRLKSDGRDHHLRPDAPRQEPRPGHELHRGHVRRDRQDAPQGPARLARKHDLPRDDAGDPPAQVRERAASRPAGTSSWSSPPSARTPATRNTTPRTSPRSSGGITPRCQALGTALYGRIVDRVVAVSSPEAAEFTKILENTFRSVNIALVNELKMLADRMDVDIWEVIEAASSKPFGFMPFYPGPGLGGHCIPIDPFYLAWKAKEMNFNTHFIELAGEINTNMPAYVVAKLGDALNARRQVPEGRPSPRPRHRLQEGHRRHAGIAGARESSQHLREKGAKVLYNDPVHPQDPQGPEARLRPEIEPALGQAPSVRGRGDDHHRPFGLRLRLDRGPRAARRRHPQRDAEGPRHRARIVKA